MPLRARNHSPAPSATRSSSPLSSGSLISYPVTTVSSESSLVLSHSDNDSRDSPDYLEPFEYSSDMESDFRRIDLVADEARLEDNDPPPLSNTESYTGLPPRVSADSPPPTYPDLPPPTHPDSPPPTHPDSPPPTRADSSPLTLRQKQKIWVVFQGREPGIYDCMVLASFQTQGFSDNFQRTYPDRESANVAWCAFMRDGTFPDYGRPPWVIFIGRRVGVTDRVTELEGSVKNYEGALFRSCSSIFEGNIKLQLFTQHITELFAGGDPFSDGGALVTQINPSVRGGFLQEELLPRTTTPTPISREHHPNTPQVARFSGSAHPYAGSGSSQASSVCTCHLSTPHPSEGWYVAYHATVPGIYHGFKAFNEAGARPGGFQCAPDEESAKNMYLELATNGMITWAGMDE